jgi:transposase
MREASPSLLKLFGCGELTAAKLLGETAGVSRFRSEAAFASYAGVAPTPHWSGQNTTRPIAAGSGNGRLNAALYRIAMTQIKRNGPANAYYRRFCSAESIWWIWGHGGRSGYSYSASEPRQQAGSTSRTRWS